MTGIWWYFVYDGFHITFTHPQLCCGIRADFVGDLRQFEAMIRSLPFCWISLQEKSTFLQFLPLHSWLVSVRTVALRNGMLYFSSIPQEWQNTKRNDTDYGRFMGVINTPSFMPLKTAFHQLLSSVSKWLMTGLLVLLVHSSSCLCSVSHQQMQIYLYNSDDFDSLSAAIKERRIIAAMAVFFEVRYLQARRSSQM